MPDSNLLFGNSFAICPIVWLSFLQSYSGLTYNFHLNIICSHLPCLVLNRVRITYSRHGSSNPLTLWVGSFIKFLYNAVLPSHSSCHFLQISSLALTHGDFLDFNLISGTFSKYLQRIEFLLASVLINSLTNSQFNLQLMLFYMYNII